MTFQPQNKSKKGDSVMFNMEKFIEEEEEEEESDSVEINLSSKNIAINFFQFYKYSKLAQERYQIREAPQQISNDIHNFQAKYKIEDESVEVFFKMIQETNVEISIDQYIDLCKLSEIFKVNPIQKFLKTYLKQHSENISFILKLMKEEEDSDPDLNEGDSDPINNSKNITKEMEDCLINNIDKCLQNPNLENLSTSKIYKLLEKSAKNAITSNFLFDFIFKSIDERFMLFHFLDLKTLSKDRFERLNQDFDSRQNSPTIKYYEYIKLDFQHIKILSESNETLNSKVERLRALKIETEKNLDILKTRNKDLNERNSQLIDNLKETNAKLNEQISQLKSENEQLNEKKLILSKESETNRNELQKLIDKIRDDQSKISQERINYLSLLPSIYSGDQYKDISLIYIFVSRFIELHYMKQFGQKILKQSKITCNQIILMLT